eukprot:s1929_g5.t4
MREGGPVVLGAVVTVVTVVGRLLGPMIGAGLVEALLSDLGVRVRGLRPVSELCKFSVERGLLRSRPLGSLARRCPAVWKTQQLEEGRLGGLFRPTAEESSGHVPIVAVLLRHSNEVAKQL